MGFGQPQYDREAARRQAWSEAQEAPLSAEDLDQVRAAFGLSKSVSDDQVRRLASLSHVESALRELLAEWDERAGHEAAGMARPNARLGWLGIAGITACVVAPILWPLIAPKVAFSAAVTAATNALTSQFGAFGAGFLTSVAFQAHIDDRYKSEADLRAALRDELHGLLKKTGRQGDLLRLIAAKLVDAEDSPQGLVGKIKNMADASRTHKGSQLVIASSMGEVRRILRERTGEL
jgi:hypothetical protein